MISAATQCSLESLWSQTMTAKKVIALLHPPPHHHPVITKTRSNRSPLDQQQLHSLDDLSKLWALAESMYAPRRGKSMNAIVVVLTKALTWQHGAKYWATNSFVQSTIGNLISMVLVSVQKGELCIHAASMIGKNRMERIATTKAMILNKVVTFGCILFGCGISANGISY